jgi:hypothetical protein
MHIRESIAQNIAARLAQIISISSPVQLAGNSKKPDSLVVQTSGTYTYTAQTKYRVEIVVAGISGVAKCTITDITDGTDSVVGQVTITSGSLISLGARGAKITFTFGSGEVMVLADKWEITCDIFNNTIKEVRRISEVGLVLENFPAAILIEAPQDYGEPDGNLYTPTMSIIVEVWNKVNESIGATLNSLLEDVENKLKADTSCGGYAFDTVFTRAEPYATEETKPFAAISIELSVKYKQVI